MINLGIVSVVIPTYRRTTLLRRAIESVRRQTHEKWEIIVVDDASPDHANADLLRALNDKRIRYIRHTENKGVSAARNTGIRAAMGEYIALLDDDDQWREDKLKRQLAAMRHFDAVLCTAVVNGVPLRVHRGSQVSLRDLRRGSFFPSGLLAKSSVLRTELFDEKLRVGEDWDVFIRIAQKHRLGWVEEPLIIYDDSGHQRTTNEAKMLDGPALEGRAAYLYKHRDFFGRFWFRRHLAVEFLPYIGSRRDKLSCLLYATRRCGPLAVLVVLFDKVRWGLRKRATRAYFRLRSVVVESKVRSGATP